MTSVSFSGSRRPRKRRSSGSSGIEQRVMRAAAAALADRHYVSAQIQPEVARILDAWR